MSYSFSRFLPRVAAALMMLAGPAAAGTPQRWETLPIEAPLPALDMQGHVAHDGASIWYGSVGTGAPVILLHGGLASADSWGNQVPALLASHHRVILIDSRGHGRSTLGDGKLSYARMESDVIAVMDKLAIRRAAFVGWSDGAILSLIVAMKHPERATRIFAFGANMDYRAVDPGAFTAPILGEAAARLARDHARLSGDPAAFARLHQAVEAMQKREPDYGAAALAAIHGPRIAIVEGDHEEFIKPAHTRFLAATIPGARLILLPGVSHFAPWQDPEGFNRAMLDFLDG